ncbi:Predicted transcriptional regulator [Rhizobium sp. RU20A]|uniref:CopG family ribbon-helix-helix protein n=1 Tax=Rhizobium sp. RU20A TaxID=1907412 RepID=UPI000955C4D9|nr:CopG family transcriptional regulator [Rhizobium sp. RU20A]SIR26939.1 Predicted transcriptional regulator [Rhizobium sp. RU20A]
MATSLKIGDALKGRIDQIASQRQRSPQGIMLEALEQYVEREEAKESFRAEALASLAAYRENGLHLTGRETTEWLERWGTDNDGPAPACHT